MKFEELLERASKFEFDNDAINEINNFHFNKEDTNHRLIDICHFRLRSIYYQFFIIYINVIFLSHLQLASLFADINLLQPTACLLSLFHLQDLVSRNTSICIDV